MIEKLSKKEINLLADKFSCLGHSLRLSIVQILHQNGSMNVTQLYNLLHVSQPSASFHLNILRHNEIVIAKRQGKNIFYSLNYDILNNMFKCLKMFK